MVRVWIDAIERWTYFMTVAGLTMNTIEQRRYQMRRVAEANLCRSPWRLKTTDLIAWMAEQDWSAESRRSYRAALRGFYRWANDAGHTHRNPAIGLPRVRTPHVLPRPAPDAVTVVAFGAASDRDRLILYLAAYAGLRRAEIAALRWADITDTVIRVRGKGGRDREVPLHPELATLLTEERDRRENCRCIGPYRCSTGYRYTATLPGTPYVFPGQSGDHMTPNAIGKAASAALGAEWGAHSLRHWFATKAYANSHDLLAVQALLGHAKPETTRRYTEIADTALRDAVNAI